MPVAHKNPQQAQTLCEPHLQARGLQNNLLIDLHIVAIISSRAMYLYNQKGCDMETWQTDMAMGVSKALYQLSDLYQQQKLSSQQQSLQQLPTTALSCSNTNVFAFML